jgi:hypothetical protein
MKWFNEKGASLGFTITTALLAAIIICALFVSCGRTHSGGVGSGLAPTGVGAHRDAPAPGGSRTAPTIPLSDLLKQIDEYVPPPGVGAATLADFKAELKRLLIARAAGAKTISVAPTGIANRVSDLAAASNRAGTQATVTWMEKLAGDYNNDGIVDIRDIGPIVLYFGQSTDSGPDDAHRLVGGDGTPAIDIGDLRAIADNYGARIQGYVVWRGRWNGASTDWDTTPRPNPNPSYPKWSTDRPSPPPVSTRPSYTYTDDITDLADKSNVRYLVAAYGDGALGTDSNEAVMPPPTYYTVSGTIMAAGSAIPVQGATLTLAPGGRTTVTGQDGRYSFSGVMQGTYSLAPSRGATSFAPASRTIRVDVSDAIGQDFSAYCGLADSAWPKLRANARNTGRSPYLGAQGNTPRWIQRLGGVIGMSSPAIDVTGNVYVGARDGDLYEVPYRYNEFDRIRHTSNGYFEASPCVIGTGYVIAGSTDGNLYAYP